MRHNSNLAAIRLCHLSLGLALTATMACLGACKNPLVEAAKNIQAEATSSRLVVTKADTTVIASGDIYDFGPAYSSAPLDATLTLKNSGTTELVLSVAGITITGANASAFTFDAPSSSHIPVGGTTTMGLHFTSSDTTTKTAVLTVPSNDVRTPSFTLTLTGRGALAEISSFKIVSPPSTGVISGRNIAVTVPFGTLPTSLTPTIVYTGSNISPASGVAQNFTNPITYTIYAVDGLSSVFYTVTVSVASNSAKELTGFEFQGLSPVVVGSINEGAQTVSAVVPYDAPIGALVPTITATGKSISPASGVAHDFSSPATYTVTADNDSTKDYVVTVRRTPQTPTISGATPTATQVDLSWPAADLATSYNLYWSTSPGVTVATGTKISGLTGTSFAHTGLSANTTYYYVLTSVKDDLESPASAQMSALTLPTAPTLSGAAPALSGQVVLTWSPPATGASSYNLYYSTSSGVTTGDTKVSGLTGTSTTVTGLTNWTPYYFKLAAVNSSGESATLSNEVSGTPARQEVLIVNPQGSVDFKFIDTTAWTVSSAPTAFLTTSASAYSVAVDPGLKAVYVANNATSGTYFSVGTYRIFDTSTGSAPAYQSAETHSEGVGADHLIGVTTPSGNKFLYTAYKDSNLVYTYSINSSGFLSLTGNQVTGLNQPRYLCADPSGKYLYISNIGSAGTAGVTACAIDPTTGALTYINGGTSVPATSSYTTGIQPFRMAIDPTGKYLYVVNWGSSTISAFSIGSDGKLTAVTGSPFTTRTNPTGIAIDPSGTHVFVTCSASPYYVSSYTIGAGGALSGELDYTGAVNSPSSIAVDATGTYAVVPNAGTANASVFAITPATGALTPKFAFGVGTGPSHVIIIKLP